MRQDAIAVVEAHAGVLSDLHDDTDAERRMLDAIADGEAVVQGVQPRRLRRGVAHGPPRPGRTIAAALGVVDEREELARVRGERGVGPEFLDLGGGARRVERAGSRVRLPLWLLGGGEIGEMGFRLGTRS